MVLDVVVAPQAADTHLLGSSRGTGRLLITSAEPLKAFGSFQKALKEFSAPAA